MNQQVTETSKLNIFAWTTYDIANTIFSMGIVSMTVLQYFTLLGMSNGFDYGMSYFIASIGVALSTLFVALTIPVIGTIADNNGKGKPGTVLFGSVWTAFITPNISTAIALTFVAPQSRTRITFSFMEDELIINC